MISRVELGWWLATKASEKLLSALSCLKHTKFWLRSVFPNRVSSNIDERHEDSSTSRPASRRDKALCSTCESGHVYM